MSASSRRFGVVFAALMVGLLIVVSVAFIPWRYVVSDNKEAVERPRGADVPTSARPTGVVTDWRQINWRRDIFALNNVSKRPIPIAIRDAFVTEFTLADRLADEETDGPNRLKARQRAIAISLKHRDLVAEAIERSSAEDRAELEVVAIETAYWGRDYSDVVQRSKLVLSDIPLESKRVRKIVYSLWTNAEILRLNSVEAKRVVEAARAELGTDALNLLSPIDHDGALRAAANSLAQANLMEDQYLNTNSESVALRRMIEKAREMAVQDISRIRYP